MRGGSSPCPPLALATESSPPPRCKAPAGPRCGAPLPDLADTPPPVLSLATDHCPRYDHLNAPPWLSASSARSPSRPSGLTHLPRPGARPQCRSPPRLPCAARPQGLHSLHIPPCTTPLLATSLARTCLKTGLQVLAVVLQKAATGRPGNSPRLTVLNGSWRIAAPATTGTPSSACDERCISCTRVAHQWTWVPTTTRDWAARPRPPPCSGDPRALATLAHAPLSPAIGSPRSSAGGGAARRQFPWGSPCTDAQKGIFKASMVHCSVPAGACFVAGGPSQDWNERSPPGACWRLLAAARLPRHCRLNSLSVPACDTSLSLYTSYTPATVLPCRGAFREAPFQPQLPQPPGRQRR